MLKSNFNSRQTWTFLLILVIGVFYFTTTECRKTEREIDNLIQREAAISEEIIKQITQERVLYIIDRGDGRISSYQIIPLENSTVFSLLKNLAERENFKIETKEYAGMGVLVESIDGVKNGVDNKYWQYWVNSELPMVAADKKEVKRGDKVEWKFASASF